jgi:hypothetical protein
MTVRIITADSDNQANAMLGIVRRQFPYSDVKLDGLDLTGDTQDAQNMRSMRLFAQGLQLGLRTAGARR